jgi:hypothetical protein
MSYTKMSFEKLKLKCPIRRALIKTNVEMTLKRLRLLFYFLKGTLVVIPHKEKTKLNSLSSHIETKT